MIAPFGIERSGTRCLYIRHNIKQSFAEGKKPNHLNLTITLMLTSLLSKEKDSFQKKNIVPVN